MQKAFKWLLPLILFGCQLDPETVYVPEIFEITDTLYVQIHDTSYVENEASFGLSTNATIYLVGIDSLEIAYWYALTKLDSAVVDSVFLTGYLIEWNDAKTHGTLMNKTLHVPWPNNARDWTYPWSYGHGEFYADTILAINDWPEDQQVSYSIQLEYK